MQPASRPVALVTGAARRIGRAIAFQLADAGLDVAVHHCSSAAEAVEVVEAITAAGGHAQAVRADLSDVAEARGLAAEVLERFGRADVLVHNASVFHSTPLAETSADDLDAATGRFLALHVTAPLALVHALAPVLRKGGHGAVVMLGDACTVRAHHAPYLASKAALASLTRSLARDLAPDVRVNMVAPGSILPAEHDGDAAVPRLVAAVPASRLGAVEEVAQAVRFLALGPEFVTGQVLAVDGGQYA